MKHPSTLVAFVSIALAAVHCGAQSTGGTDSGTVTADTGTVGTDGGTTTSDAGPATPPCPASLPHSGDPCTREGIVCEYGDTPPRACRPTAECHGGVFQLSLPPCATLPPTTCPATRDAAAGQSCDAMNAICSYAGLECTCTNCSTGGPATQCTGTPTWHCEAPNADPSCPAALPDRGSACATEAQTCRYACGGGGARVCTGGAWYAADGGPCPVSSRRAKHDIAYLAPDAVDGLANAVAHTRLATYEYNDAALAGRRHLGFVIEDQPASYAVDPERNQVDLYGYTSMLVAAVQSQQRHIEALEREVRALRTHATARPGR